MLVLSSSSQNCALGVVIDRIEVILLFFVLTADLVEASARGSMPVLDVTIGVGCNKDVGGLEFLVIRSPSDSSDRHVITAAMRIDQVTECKCALASLGVEDPHCSVTVSASQILVCGIKSASENFGLLVSP